MRTEPPGVPNHPSLVYAGVFHLLDRLHRLGGIAVLTERIAKDQSRYYIVELLVFSFLAIGLLGVGMTWDSSNELVLLGFALLLGWRAVTMLASNLLMLLTMKGKQTTGYYIHSKLRWVAMLSLNMLELVLFATVCTSLLLHFDPAAFERTPETVGEALYHSFRLIVVFDESGRRPASGAALLNNAFFSAAGFSLIAVSLAVLISFKPSEEKVNAYAVPLATQHWGWRSSRISESQWATDAILQSRFIEFIRPAAKDSLLDVGCGDGSFTAAVARNTGVEAVGVDYCRQMNTHARETIRDGAVKFVLDDGRTLALSKPRSVDTAVMRMYLHNLTRKDAVDSLAAVARVLRPEGKLIVIECVPFDDNESTEFFRRINNERQSCQLMYEAGVWRDFIASNGFKVVREEEVKTRISAARWLDNTVEEPTTRRTILSLYEGLSDDARDVMSLERVGSGPAVDYHLDIRFVSFECELTT